MSAPDLVIAGGGPAGLATAIRARMAGLEAVVLDAARPPIDKACGEGLMPDGVEVLSSLGVNLDGVETRAIGGIRYLDGERVSEGRFPGASGLGIRRTVLHDVLRRRAAQVGVDLRWGCRVLGLTEGGFVTDDGPVMGEWLIGADGRLSRVRKWAGLDGRRARQRRIGVRRHYEIEPWADVVEVYWDDGCEAYVTPVGQRLVGVAVLWEGKAMPFDGLLSRFPALEERLGGAAVGSTDRGAGPLEQRCRRVTRGNLALVGDASGYLDPITGEGLALAFKEASAVVDAILDGRLDSYRAAHRRIVRYPFAVTRLLLEVERRPGLRRRVMRSLVGDATLMSRFLALKMRLDGPKILGGDGLMALVAAAFRGRKPYGEDQPISAFQRSGEGVHCCKANEGERMGVLEECSLDVTVLILGGGRGSRLSPLTLRRSKPAVPVAGKYRLIDIPISNAINSGMERMYVLTQFNSVSLHRHIGRTYRFDAFSRGYVQILAAQQTPTVQTWFQGTADAVRQNINIFSQIQGDHVLILSGDHMYRMDYRQLLHDHIENNADITIAVKPCSEEEIAGFGAAMVNESGRIIEFREKPATPEARKGMEVVPSLLKAKGVAANLPYIASMGVYIFRKDALVEALDNELVDFGGDIIPAEVSRRRVQAHFFKGYWRDIGTIGAFFDAHMDLVQPDPEFTFHDQSWPIYTRPRYLPGAKLHGCRFDHVLLGDGSRVEDTVAENSVLGLRSNIRGATIRRSLIMGVDGHYPAPNPGEPPVGIGEGSEIFNAIIDKNARIGRGVRICNERGVQEAEGDDWEIRDGIVVVEKNGVVPDGTVI